MTWTEIDAGIRKHPMMCVKVTAAILVVLLMASGLAWFARNPQPPQERVAPDLSLHLVDGTSWNLADQRGKVVVLNFWATWCDPCQREAPELQAVSDAAPDDVVIVGIAAKSDKAANVDDFIRTHSLTYPVGQDRNGDGPYGEITQAYKVLGFPTTVFIGPEGTISDVVLLPLDAGEIDAYVARARSS